MTESSLTTYSYAKNHSAGAGNAVQSPVWLNVCKRHLAVVIHARGANEYRSHHQPINISLPVTSFKSAFISPLINRGFTESEAAEIKRILQL